MDKRLLRFTEYLGEADKSEPGYVPSDQEIIDIMKAQDEQGKKWEKEYKKSIDSLIKTEKSGKIDPTPVPGEESKKKKFYFFSAFKTYNSLDDAGKKGVIESVKEWFKTKKKKLNEDNYQKTIKVWKKEMSDKSSPNYNLYVMVVPEDAKDLTKPIDDPGKKGIKLEDHSVIPDENKNSLFVNNMWNIEKPEEAFTDPTLGDEIKKGLKEDISDDWFNYSEKKEHLLKSIEINSSCSRYRNTEPSEKMSWAELAFKRAGTFAKFIQDTAREISGSDEYVNSVRKLIALDYLGSNGDGTSGPDPGKNKEGKEVRKGYYLKNESDFTDKKEKGLLKIGVVGVDIKDGQPVLNGKVEMKEALGLDRQPIKEDPKGPEDYDKYKFIEVNLRYKEGATIDPNVDDPGSEISGEKTKTEGKKLLVRFPSSAKPPGSGGGGGSDTGKRRKRNPPAPSIPTKGKAIPCPAF